MNLAKISIKRPTFITSVIVTMLIVGMIFMKRMSVDMFPNVTFPFVIVTTIYPGAGPQETETLISKVLEDQFSTIAGLKNITSTSQDGLSIVFGEFTLETDAKDAEQQVKDKIAQVRNTLPDDIKEPVVRRFDPADMPVLMLSLSANLSPTELYTLADTEVRNALSQIPNVSSIDIIGGTKREIHVDLDRTKLKEHETSVSNVATRIAANSQNIPIGKVSLGKKELTFRSIGEFRSLKQINDVVVSFFGNDVPISISQIGTVTDGTQEIKTKGYLNGQSALVLSVYKQSGSNSVKVSDALQKRIEKLNLILKDMKGAPQVSMVRDTARPIRMNIKDVTATIFEGILLAILVVYFFLGNWRSTIITVIALPNSLIGAFIFMGLAGFSVNMLTLMALSLAVGLLIDDAIVVRENIFRHMENGADAMTAAQKGTDEVTLAVIATTLTVIAVFLPVGFLQGTVGQFFKEFGLTIVFAMAISLFDALTTAPMLSAYLIGTIKHETDYKGFSRVLRMPVRLFERFQKWLEHTYERSMHLILKHKISMIIIVLLIFAGSLTLASKIPKTFMPTNEFGEFIVDLESQPGTSLEQMDKYAVDVDNLLRKEKDIELVLSTVGNTNGESNVASLFIRMVPAKQRKRSTVEMKEYVRALLSKYKKELTVEVSDISMSGNEKPFTMLLVGDDLDALANASFELMKKFGTIPKLVDINTNYRPGKPEFQINTDPKKMEILGVQSVLAGAELRAMVEGVIPAKYRENGIEYEVRVRLKEEQRDLARTFNDLYVPNVNFQLVKVANFARPINTSGPSKINRRNRSRYVQITGNLGKDGAIGNITDAAKKIMENEKLPKGVSYEFIGASEDMIDLFKSMVIAAGLSIVFIFLVLASLYESLIIPFTIMLALPLSIVGGLVALYLAHQSLNMFTMIGFIMLLGLVTKNSILLVDYAQRLIRTGLSDEEAIIKAGLIRLRPILMTTLALIAGMTPLALALTEVGKFRRSMGVAIIGGLVSSTVLTLVVIPAMFEYMNRFRRWTRKLVGRPVLREIDKAE